MKNTIDLKLPATIQASLDNLTIYKTPRRADTCEFFTQLTEISTFSLTTFCSGLSSLYKIPLLNSYVSHKVHNLGVDFDVLQRNRNRLLQNVENETADDRTAGNFIFERHPAVIPTSFGKIDCKTGAFQ